LLCLWFMSLHGFGRHKVIFPRLVSVVAAAAVLVSGALVSVPGAVGDDSRPSVVVSGLLDEERALELASQTGQEVVVSALTGERSLTVADPITGNLRTELSVEVARVRDQAGGWRDPSAKLVVGDDGLLRPEAAAVDYAISGGGDTAFMEMSTPEGSVAWTLPDALPVPQVDGDTATFEEVFPGVDLVARAGVEAVESFLVVKDREAGQNPDVREFAFDAEYEGLSAVDSADGGLSLVDAEGREVLEVPPALMWDSAGVPAVEREAVIAGDGGSADLIDVQDGSTLADVELDASGDSLAVVADETLLDDPQTVYPVVIDPEVKPGRTYGVRVISTKQFVKKGADLSEGKVGYSPSPYEGKLYNSRMFFQFSWPKYTNPATGVNDFVSSAQIVKGTFEYNQTHSPQHSPCKSTSKSYSGVKARLYNTISSSTNWPGPGAHSWAAVTDYLAVGHESYCKTSKVQDWNITSMLQSERAHDSYKTRTTVTIGLYSADEGSAIGWREYKTPKLVIEYEPAPPAPTEFEVTPSVVVDGMPVTSGSTLQLKVKAGLAAGMTCQALDACAGVSFTVKAAGSGEIVFEGSAAAKPDVWLHVSPGLLAPGEYLLEASAYNVTTGMGSLPSTFSFRVADLKLSGWSWASEVKADQEMKIMVPAQDLKPGRSFCVYDSEELRGCYPASDDGLVAVGEFSVGKHSVLVAVRDDATGLIGDQKADNPPVRIFEW
jgi:hypothetical protein